MKKLLSMLLVMAMVLTMTKGLTGAMLQMQKHINPIWMKFIKITT